MHSCCKMLASQRRYHVALASRRDSHTACLTIMPQACCCRIFCAKVRNPTSSPPPFPALPCSRESSCEPSSALRCANRAACPAVKSGVSRSGCKGQGDGPPAGPAMSGARPFAPVLGLVLNEIVVFTFLRPCALRPTCVRSKRNMNAFSLLRYSVRVLYKIFNVLPT